MIPICRRFITVLLKNHRSSLYQSNIDVYIIFIAPFDLFGEKKYMYTFRMTCDEVIAEGKELGIEMGRAQGRAEGCAESHAKDIERLIKNTGWSIEKAMDILEIPVDERSLYIEMIGHMD